jgi:Ca2+-transporting ATPase
MQFYQKTSKELATDYSSNLEEGISQKNVSELQAKYGKNVLRAEHHTAWYVLLGRQFSGILIYILVVAAIVSALLGENIDAIAIGVILLINGVLGFIQEQKAQSSIESLQQLARSSARVIRDNKEQDISAEELVPGDIIILETGDKVPADARIITETNLEAAEGALTGESVPVSKVTEVISGHQQLGDQKNMVFSGTVITKGRARAIVVATAMKSEIGKIAHMIQDAQTEQTPLQRSLDALSAKLGTITIAICMAIFAFIVIGQRTFTLEALKEPFLLSISLAVAAIPEGLPIVVTIALAFGTQRMVKKHALIKQLSSVETLGETTVICSDKTGTLTKNEMTVTHVYYNGADHTVTGTGYEPVGEIEGNLPDIFSEIAMLCNDAKLSEQEEGWSVHGDPTEGCLLTLARKDGFDEHTLQTQHPRIAEVPFDSERKRMSTVHDLGDTRHILTKGAPDIILEQCSKILDENGIRTLTEKDKKIILTQNEAYATQALRVLGFAYKQIEKKDTYSEEDENDLVFVGLTGMIDPARPEAKEAIVKCQEAGIRVVMITGDHQTTAAAIAKELGITGRVITGAQLSEIDLDAQVNEIGVFARVNPEDKMQIVNALKRNGHIVAMTGDGVNDAPALKQADIGIAMGITGTDVAKESASMILTDDNFSSIVNAVEEGRNIYTNIKKFVNYLLSSNFAEVLTIFLSIFLFTHNGEIVWPLTATMILYMNLLTDSLPALALGVDPGDPEVMKRKPRDPKEPIITTNLLSNIILIGVIVAAATLLVFRHALETTGNVAYAQTLALTTLVILEIVRLAMIRSQYNTPFFSNNWLTLAVITVFGLQAIVIYTPFMQTVFGTVALGWADWGLLLGVAVATYIVGMIAGKGVQRVTGQLD